MTSYYSMDTNFDEGNIKDAIELFLTFLRTYNMEALCVYVLF